MTTYIVDEQQSNFIHWLYVRTCKVILEIILFTGKAVMSSIHW